MSAIPIQEFAGRREKAKRIANWLWEEGERQGVEPELRAAVASQLTPDQWLRASKESMGPNPNNLKRNDRQPPSEFTAWMVMGILLERAASLQRNDLAGEEVAVGTRLM